jgi:predicted metal-dependent enzyme (double-stranded beta helix superfamily)
MTQPSIPSQPDAVSPFMVLEYWMARLPSKPQVFGRRQQGGARLSRSLVRLPRKFGFEAWWIRWPPGSVAPLHDHGQSSSVVGILHGTLHEVVHSPDAGIRARRNWTPEYVIELAGDECHEVRNLSNATAASVHVYQPRLESMNFYHHTFGGKLEPVRATVSNTR